MGITIKEVEKWAQKNKVNKLLKALSTDNVDVRIAAIKALGTTNNESAMHSLITLLKDPDAAIRISAVEALGAMGNGRSLEFVRQMWNNETDEKVREKAKLAVNAIKEKMTKEEKL